MCSGSLVTLLFVSVFQGWGGGWGGGVVTMLSVGGLARSGFLELRLLQLPARGVCSAVIHRKSPACVTWCAGASVGPPSACHRLPVRMTSGVGGGDVANDAAGVVTGASGWYGSLADSAPVHLFEHFLVSAQQVSGLPWWLSIVGVTLSVRTLITLPLAAYQLVIISKVSWGWWRADTSSDQRSMSVPVDIFINIHYWSVTLWAADESEQKQRQRVWLLIPHQFECFSSVSMTIQIQQTGSQWHAHEVPGCPSW